MAQLDTQAKLAILADAAKYDASCASSGTPKRDSRGGKGVGSTEGMGICHAYAPDGRCISLLKILLTNWCIYDCLYCINRESSAATKRRSQGPGLRPSGSRAPGSCPVATMVGAAGARDRPGHAAADTRLITGRRLSAPGDKGPASLVDQERHLRMPSPIGNRQRDRT